jgi:putative DNA primase/helicase
VNIQQSAEDIAVGNWEEILVRAGLDQAYLKHAEGPCPICGGKTRFRWRAKKESGFCNSCRYVGPFTLLQHLIGSDFRGAADYVRNWAGYGESTTPGQAPRPIRVARPAPVEADDTEDLRFKYRKLWGETTLIEPGIPAHAYLLRRVPGLTAIPKVLRAHAALPYWRLGEDGMFHNEGNFPAMLAAAQGVDGRVANIWRTYLDASGDKASLPDAKKAVGRFLQPSFAVRLTEPDDELGIAEGIETALAVWILFGIPCWSTLHADGMRKFEIPQGYERVRKVRIFADNDARDQNGRRAGNDAANLLKDKMRANGLISTVVLPKFTTFDFADIAVKKAA